MSKRRKDLSEEEQQVEREKNKIEHQRRQSRLLQEEREEQRERKKISTQKYRDQLKKKHFLLCFYRD